VFDDQINAPLLSDFANTSRPLRIGGVDHKLRTQGLRKFAFSRGRAGGDNVSAELPGDLNCVSADATGARDDQHPGRGTDFGAIGEHVHGGAAREREGCARSEIDALGDSNERARGHRDDFGEPAIAVDSEKLAVEADRFLAAETIFAKTTEEIGLDSNAFTDAPIVDVFAEFDDLAGDFGPKNAW